MLLLTAMWKQIHSGELRNILRILGKMVGSEELNLLDALRFVENLTLQGVNHVFKRPDALLRPIQLLLVLFKLWLHVSLFLLKSSHLHMELCIFLIDFNSLLLGTKSALQLLGKLLSQFSKALIILARLELQLLVDGVEIVVLTLQSLVTVLELFDAIGEGLNLIISGVETLASIGVRGVAGRGGNTL